MPETVELDTKSSAEYVLRDAALNLTGAVPDSAAAAA
jgi:hypothetical protein